MRLLFRDDFTSYADNAAFQAAYPGLDGLGGDWAQLTWSPTGGPDGQPGIHSVIPAPSAPHTGSGTFDVFPLRPQGRSLRVKGRFKHLTASGGSMTFGIGFAPYADPLSDYFGLGGAFVVDPAGGPTNPDLHVNAGSIPPSATGSPATTWNTVITSAVPVDAPFDLQVDITVSTFTETSPGVFTPNSDGHFAASVNGVEVVSFDGPVWNRDSSTNEAPAWNDVSISVNGYFTGLEIWDDPAPDVDLTTPCCSTVPKGSPNAGDTPKVDSRSPLPPWIVSCTAGADLPAGNADANSEDWRVA